MVAQVHVLGGGSWAEVEAELDSLREDGFNAIFFRVFQNEGDRYHGLAAAAAESGEVGVYFASSRAPVVADMVTPLAALCRQRGLRLYAWMTTRRMDWLASSGWRDRRFDLATGSLQRERHHDLFNPEFKSYLLDIYEEIARLPIDGIVLQDDFVIKSYEGFTAAGLAGYRERFGVDLEPGSLFLDPFRGDDGMLHPAQFGAEHGRWCRFKSDLLLELGAELVRRCKRADVDIELVLNVYYDTALVPDKALEWLGQSLEGVIASPFDLLCLMSYHRQAARELDISVTEAIALMSELSAQLHRRLGDRMIVKLQAVDWESGEEIGSAELERVIQAAGGQIRKWALAPVESDGEVRSRFGKILAARDAGRQ